MKKISIVIIFVLFSCKQTENIEYQVIAKFDENMSSIKTFGNIEDYYTSLEIAEKILMNNKILGGNTKKDYLKLINNTNKLPLKKIRYINNLIYEKKLSFVFWGDLSLANFKKSIIDCLSKNNPKPNYLLKFIKLYDKMEAEGFQNPKTISEIYEINNFDNRKIRLFMLDLYFVHLDTYLSKNESNVQFEDS